MRKVWLHYTDFDETVARRQSSMSNFTKIIKYGKNVNLNPEVTYDCHCAHLQGNHTSWQLCVKKSCTEFYQNLPDIQSLTLGQEQTEGLTNAVSRYGVLFLLCKECLKPNLIAQCSLNCHFDVGFATLPFPTVRCVQFKGYAEIDVFFKPSVKNLCSERSIFDSVTVQCF